MMGLSPAEACESNPLNAKRGIADSIDELRRADQTFYNLMTLEIWSLAQTMDELKPGFWADYMRNRQAIVRQYIQERRQEQPNQTATPEGPKAAIARKLSPFHPLVAQARREDESKRVSLFSSELEQDLPKVMPRAGRMSVLARPDNDDAAAFVEAAIAGEELEIVAVDAATAEPLRDRVHPFDNPTAPKSAPLKSQPAVVELATPEIVESAEATQFALVKLPHLMRFPVLKAIPSTHLPTPQWVSRVAIACWLTRNFLVCAPGERVPSVQKRLDAIAVEPGESVICQLGFQLLGTKSAVEVQLVKALREEQRLSVKWIEARVDPQANSAANCAEAMVQLTNHGTQAIMLKAGKAFCCLEVLCATTSI